MASATGGKRATPKNDLKNNGVLSPKHNIDAAREAYYDRISKFDMAPLWKVMKSVVTKEPAIRFVLDGEGAYTAVEGEKAYMSPGDFVITANWAPHDHGNPSKKPMLWLDVLDFPAVNFYEASFADYYEEGMQNTTRQNGDSLTFYGSGVLPEGAPLALNRSPVINYTYARTRPILERLRKSGEVDPRHGARVHYVNPINGGPVLPTMGASLALLPKGFKGVEGQGTTKIGEEVFEWGPNDIFVVPPWRHYAHMAARDSVLFSISDRPAQQALGIWREEKSAH